MGAARRPLTRCRACGRPHDLGDFAGRGAIARWGRYDASPCDARGTLTACHRHLDGACLVDAPLDPAGPRCDCGGTLETVLLRARTTERRCDDACRLACGTDCACSCGGVAHGRARG